MLKRGYIIITMILSLVSMKSQAQYDVSFSHYFDMEPSFNAAAVGKSPKLNIAAAYAMQMAGFKRNPNTMYAGADAQFLLMKQFHGAGVQFMNDQIGLFSHKRLALQYAFKFKLFGGQLSTGISAGLLSESFDGTKVDLEESNDPAFSSSKVDGNSVDLAAGLYYSHRNWYVGVSAQHLNSPCVKLGETNELQGRRHLLSHRRRNHPSAQPVPHHPTLVPRAQRPLGLSRRHHRTPRLHQREEDDVRRRKLRPYDINDGAHRRQVPRHRPRLLLRDIHLCHQPRQRKPRAVHRLPDGPQPTEEGPQHAQERESAVMRGCCGVEMVVC